MHVVLVILGALLLTLEIALRLVALGIIPGNRKPSTGMAWLLLILVEPIIGFAIFGLFGRRDLGRHRLARQQEATAAIRAVVTALPMPHDESRFDPPVRTIVALNTELGALPMVEGNQMRLCPDYGELIAQLAAEIDAATSYVHVEFYITAWDDVTAPVFEAMIRATERGVRVRLLFDHLGSRGIPGYRRMLERLRETALEWHPMLPIDPLRGRFRRPDLRNHRKLVVVDGAVAFTGSLNLTEPGYNKPKNHRAGRRWVELMVRLEGPVVGAVNTVFASDWYVETGELVEIGRRRAELDPAAPARTPCQIVPSGPGYPQENNLRMFTALLYSATRRISLTSPYFVPDESLLYAVTTAAQRGVEVELFVSETSDQFMVGHAQASYYRELLEAGVRIHLYPSPAILHAKHFTIDDTVAVVGSSNMDMRSFALNYEICLMMPDVAAVRELRRVEDTYRSLCRELTLAEWNARSPLRRYVDNVMRLTAALQ
ncbi:MAG: cardiolipin synthase [Nocardioides sp.]|uniref:cardiolipin synthase n=1 Tax=Nocardioides sp. TaxID=35761 RepID=UPI0039E409C9